MKDAVTWLNFQGNHGESKSAEYEGLASVNEYCPLTEGKHHQGCTQQRRKAEGKPICLTGLGRHSVCKLGRELRSLLRHRAYCSEVYHELCRPSLVSLLARAVFGFIPSVQAVTVFPVTLITAFSCPQLYTSFTYLLPLPSG